MSETNKNSIAFLFGAGISQSSLISTQSLTEKILSAENVVHLSGGYFLHPNPKIFEDIDVRGLVPKIQELIKIIIADFSNHYMFSDSGMNYEDIYYLINSIYEEENGEYANPIISKYCDSFREKYARLFKAKFSDFGDLRLIDLASEALNYIRNLIAINLSKPAASLDHLNFLSEIHADESLSKIYIFTLNHDILIEQYCNNKIVLSDGFIPDGNGNRIWSAKSFNEKFSLLKLHGSINWYRMIGQDLYDDRTVIYGSPKRGHDEPLIIIGRFNKLQEYTRSINFELQCLFANQLDQTNNLIISGYSFGDQGINSRLIHWALGSRERRIFVIHKDPDDLIKNARPAIRKIFSFLIKKDKVIYVKDFITKDTKWSDIKKFLLNKY
ncbi:MAG: hypothetical protein EPN88_17170 [Bacteroidetes bacterium]|nr:MAG: hypothetical protein EPN88_17170 [Bacteroidota bacterium]